MNIGLRTRKYFRCVIRCSGRPTTGVDSWKCCYAVVHKADGSRTSISIEGEYNVNRALDGDVVAIEILEQQSSGDTSNMFIDTNNNSNDAMPLGLGEVSTSTAEASDFQIEGIAPSSTTANSGLRESERGRVVGIIRRNWRQYAGSLVPLDSITGDNQSKQIAGLALFMYIIYLR